MPINLDLMGDQSSNYKKLLMESNKVYSVTDQDLSNEKFVKVYDANNWNCVQLKEKAALVIDLEDYETQWYPFSQIGIDYDDNFYITLWFYNRLQEGI